MPVIKLKKNVVLVSTKLGVTVVFDVASVKILCLQLPTQITLYNIYGGNKKKENDVLGVNRNGKKRWLITRPSGGTISCLMMCGSSKLVHEWVFYVLKKIKILV